MCSSNVCGLPEGEELGTLDGEELGKPLGILEGEELGSLLGEELEFTEGLLLGLALETLLGDALEAELGPLDCVHSKIASIRIKVTLKNVYRIE